MGHVDIGKAHCPAAGNTNISACYGVQDADKYSVMGQGMQLREKHANPWREAITKLTGKGNVTNVTDWLTKNNRHYPRTLIEATAKKQIIIRPKR